mgnify:CR=1 FL=1
MKTTFKFLLIVYLLSSCKVEYDPGFAEITYNLKLVNFPEFNQKDTLIGHGFESVHTIGVNASSDTTFMRWNIHDYKGVGSYDLDKVGFFIRYTSTETTGGTSDIFTWREYNLEVIDTLDSYFEITSIKNGVHKGKFNLYAKHRLIFDGLIFNFSDGEFEFSIAGNESKFILSR